MSFRPPRYHRPAGSVSYGTCLLAGYALSLGLLLAAAHLPVSSSFSTRWTLRSAPHGLLVHEVQEETDGNEESSSEGGRTSEITKELPPQTRQRPSSPSESQGASPDKGNDEASGSEESPTSEPSNIPEVTSRTDIREPEMVGGMGSYYLRIQYPEAARQEGIEGRLRLRFVVTKDGHTRHIRVTEPLHPLTDSAAVQALRSVRFRPALHEGEPQPVWMSLPVRFRLLSDSTQNQTADADPAPNPQ